MIPLRDDIPTRRRTPINKLLVVTNIAVFLYQLTLGQQIGEFFYHYGLIPAEFLTNPDCRPLPYARKIPATSSRQSAGT